MDLLWVQGGHANFCLCCTKEEVVVIVDMETGVSIVTIPCVLPGGSVHTVFSFSEVDFTISVAAALWTGFSTTVAIVIIDVVVTWIQRLIFTELAPLPNPHHSHAQAESTQGNDTYHPTDCVPKIPGESRDQLEKPVLNSQGIVGCPSHRFRLQLHGWLVRR